MTATRLPIPPDSRLSPMKQSLPWQILLAFIAGLLGVVTFHQGFAMIVYGVLGRRQA
jgi:hypothetical protein